jgi:hypothetical protein
MTKVIMIIILLSNSDRESSTSTAEFDTMEACIVAQKAIVQKYNWTIITAACFYKGTPP